MSEIAFSIGTRAELIKIFPVLKQMKDYTLIHTGQHNISELLDKFGLDEPDIVLSEPPKDSTKFYFNTAKAVGWTASMIQKIGKAAKEKGAKVLVYHGDTMTTAASAISSWKHILKGVHIEAGLRSGSIWEPFPEEISRRIADSFSNVAFAVSEGTVENLQKAFAFNGEIVNTGNTGIDAALLAYKMNKGNIKPPKEDYAIVTLHRQENLRNYKRMLNIVRIIKTIPIKTYFFAHDNTLNALRKHRLLKPLSKHVKIAKISDYFVFISWLKSCKLILTDGGSIQEESLVFKKPCIILRNRTERTEGLHTGLNYLSKFDILETEKKINEFLSDDFKIPKFTNPYGKAGTSKTVVKELKKLVDKLSD